MLNFVLVEPAVPENVGAAARAIKTMGFGSLWIVNSDAHMQKPARILAHGAHDILERVRTFPDLAAVRTEVDMLVGTSAKPRHHRDVLLSPEALRDNLQDKQESATRVALVFGREESGLHSNEIALCDLLTTMPLACSYPSLNLGQAVMLYAYVLNRIEHQPATLNTDTNQYAALRNKCGQLLQQIGYAPNEKLYQWVMEHLPLLNKRSIGFSHHLVDKLQRFIGIEKENEKEGKK